MRKAVLVGVSIVGALAVAAAALVSIRVVQALRPPGPECTVPQASGQPLGIDAVQLQHASTINAVGLRRGLPQRAMVIALATALQESSLRNLPGGDRDSVGLFQQRPSQGWGTPAQLQDPVYAAGKFYDALVKVRDWQTLPLTEVAQAVQYSAHPTAYAKWEDEATALATALSGTAPLALSCRAGAQPSTAAMPHRPPLAGLTGAAPDLAAVLAAAQAELGGLTAVSVPDGGHTGTVAVRLPGKTPTASARALAAWAVAHSTTMGITDVAVDGQHWADHHWSTGAAPPAGQVTVTVG